MRPQLLLLVPALFTFACAGSAPPPSGAPTRSEAAEAPPPAQPQAGYAPHAESESAGEPYDESAPAASGAAADRHADVAQPSPRRPGLGTTWGETRVSRISTTPFFRADSVSPSAVASFFYNDRQGVQEMTRGGFVTHDQGVISVSGGALTVRLLDDARRPLPGVQSGGRNYVVGQHGQRYVIQIQNHTPARVEAVATVDGLDVIDGREGAFTKRGYIVMPYSTVEIDGFRRSTDTVASFRFGSVDGSYAARKGSSRNVGVIGVAFFHEQGDRWGWGPGETRRRHDADPFPGGFAEPPPSW
ncbi:MAG: hypothetical protein KIT72_03395 [Polyangiaceae bacterium]|nr:hypothetical protein [Polyangiaceae bacterium]MCW5789445.1 hypothetical protein [Polyangiaceae bacterium]